MARFTWSPDYAIEFWVVSYSRYMILEARASSGSSDRGWAGSGLMGIKINIATLCLSNLLFVFFFLPSSFFFGGILLCRMLSKFFHLFVHVTLSALPMNHTNNGSSIYELSERDNKTLLLHRLLFRFCCSPTNRLVMK